MTAPLASSSTTDHLAARDVEALRVMLADELEAQHAQVHEFQATVDHLIGQSDSDSVLERDASPPWGTARASAAVGASRSNAFELFRSPAIASAAHLPHRRPSADVQGPRERAAGPPPAGGPLAPSTLPPGDRMTALNPAHALARGSPPGVSPPASRTLAPPTPEHAASVRRHPSSSRAADVVICIRCGFRAPDRADMPGEIADIPARWRAVLSTASPAAASAGSSTPSTCWPC